VPEAAALIHWCRPGRSGWVAVAGYFPQSDLLLAKQGRGRVRPGL